VRKTHLRYVLDKELDAFITLCGLTASPARPLTDNEAEVTCARCKTEIDLINDLTKKNLAAEAEKRSEEEAPAKKPRKKRKGNENGELHKEKQAKSEGEAE
jgi:hypothetical protein